MSRLSWARVLDWVGVVRVVVWYAGWVVGWPCGTGVAWYYATVQGCWNGRVVWW